MGSAGQEMYRKINFHIFEKTFWNLYHGANDDLDGETTHFNCFLHKNDNRIKMSKTSHSVWLDC